MRRFIFSSVFFVLVFATVSFATDSGFRCDPNGFGFRNYSNVDDVENLSPAEVVRLFGPAAKARGEGDSIVLVPAAEQWMEDINEAMNIGHCEGLAVLSYLFHIGKINPGKFGAETAGELQLKGNPALQREIAFWWATQVTETTRSAKIRLTPTEVLDYLRKGLPTRDPAQAYSLQIWMPDWTRGHAVTPYAVVDTDDSHSRILLYDNNFPKQERFIEVDREENSWSYSTATNPNEPINQYVGDANTKTLLMTPCSVRMQIQKADFLKDAPWSEENGLDEPTEDGLEPGDEVPEEEKEDDPDDSAGSADPAGAGSGKAEKAGKGALHGLMKSTFSERDDPASDEFAMEISLSGKGGDLLITDSGGKRVGYDKGVLVNEIPGAEVVRFAGSPASPALEVEPRYLLPGGRDYVVSLIGTTGTDEPVSISCLGRGTELVVDDISMVPATVEVEIKRIASDTVSTYTNDDLRLATNDAAYFHFAAWKGNKSSMEVDFDLGGDDDIDSESQYSDEE